MTGRAGGVLPDAAARALLGGGLALVVARSPLPGGDARWRRSNHRGACVLLTSGPALALAAGASGGPQPAAAVAGLVAGLAGSYDDVAGARQEERGVKGVRGHLSALRRGQVTAGTVKIVAVGAGALVAAALMTPRSPLDVVLRAGVVAGTANLLNLLDLRPGRALKVGLAAGAALSQPGPAAAAGVLLPDDLGERTMLGDAGANALGAVLGVGLAARLRERAPLTRVLAGLVALTAASEVVSYSRVIDAVPPLRALDRLGRRP